MIKFFRKIRYNLMEQGLSAGHSQAGNASRTARYLLYATGEIILVVIGILIALQINNLNQNHINKKTEIYYLTQLMNDLPADSLYLQQEIVRFTNNLPIIENLIFELYQENNKKTFNQAITNYIDKVLHPLVFNSTNAAYNEMQSSAKLGIIRDKQLRNQIVNLYNHLEEMKVLYSHNYDFISFIDVQLIYGKGLAKYQYQQKDLFAPYFSEDELYKLKKFKDDLEGNAANWNWSIRDILPYIEAQLEELRSVMGDIEKYLHKIK